MSTRTLTCFCGLERTAVAAPIDGGRYGLSGAAALGPCPNCGEYLDTPDFAAGAHTEPRMTTAARLDYEAHGLGGIGRVSAAKP